MDDPLNPHSHDPNPAPPSADPALTLLLPNGRSQTITVDYLRTLPQTAVNNHYIVSTGHGTSGPFIFSGVTLLALLESVMPFPSTPFSVEVISADGFGNRVHSPELFDPDPAGPILLCLDLDGQPMTREQGLVRMIVPNEKDDALRQVKWVGTIKVVPA